jgi:two-component system sensor histidine kinase/response regulator
LYKPINKSYLYDSIMMLLHNKDSDRNTLLAGHSLASGGAQREVYSIPGARVLLVEDNPVNQQIALELLEDADARVVTAGTGIEALEALERSTEDPPFDVVLMDLQMPGMDGYEATRRIRENPRFATMPIVAMTAHAMIEERLKCLQCGMNDHISKPIEVGKFFSTLRTWLQSGGYGMGHASFGVPAGAGDAAGSGGSASLPPLPGINADAALNRLNGNTALYERILRQFLRTQSGMEAAYKKAAADVDPAAQKRIVHTLRGLGSSIGASILASTAGNLERAFEAEYTTEKGDAEKEVFAALDSLLRMLREAFPDEASAAPSETAGRKAPVLNEETAAALAAFEGLLRDDDAAAGTFLDENEAALREALGDAALQGARQALARFDFEEVLRFLEEAGKPPA